MEPIAVLMLSEAIEADRRRVLRQPRHWMNAEPAAEKTKVSGILRFPRLFRLVGSKA